MIIKIILEITNENKNWNNSKIKSKNNNCYSNDNKNWNHLNNQCKNLSSFNEKNNFISNKSNINFEDKSYFVNSKTLKKSKSIKKKKKN